MILLNESKAPVTAGFEGTIQVFSPLSYKLQKLLNTNCRTNCLKEQNGLLLVWGTDEELLIWDTRRNYILARKIFIGNLFHKKSTLGYTQLFCTINNASGKVFFWHFKQKSYLDASYSLE